MNLLRSSWFPLLLGIALFTAIVSKFAFKESKETVSSFSTYNSFTEEWKAPDTTLIPSNTEGDLIRYGRELIIHTSKYLGPRGIVAQISNGMNCQNCHIDAGAKPFGNSFAAVASTYPRYRDRSGKMESVEFRINECMERSLNGSKLGSNSLEMKAMLAYFNWMGEGVPKTVRPKGSGTEELPLMDRASDPAKGKRIYTARCQRCHGENGAGYINADSTYLYPPLWGDKSYNVSAGMYRLTRLAGFIKNNMPFDSVAAGARLTNEDAWDLAAYINSQPRPQKKFSYDWPDVSTKPFDHPFGPYTDGFSELQHKYGPFKPIKEAQKRNKAQKLVP